MTRRRVLSAATVVLLLVSAGLRIARHVHRGRAPKTTTESVPPGVRPYGRSAVVASEPHRGDVDGDGAADTVTLVRWPHDPVQWYGVHATLDSGARRTAWYPFPGDGRSGELLGLVDVDGDGRTEIVLAAAARHVLYTLDRGRLTLVQGPHLRTATVEHGGQGWGCEGGRVYTTLVVQGSQATEVLVTYHRLAGRRLVKEESRVVRFPAGTDAPPPYGAYLRCGAISR